MEKQLAEETVGENMTEETKTDNRTTVMTVNWSTLNLLSVVLLFCGWLLPIVSLKENDNVKIPDYVWFFSAVFQGFGTVIWIDIMVASHRSKRTRNWLPLSSFMLFLCLTSCLSLFTWFCTTREKRQ